VGTAGQWSAGFGCIWRSIFLFQPSKNNHTKKEIEGTGSLALIPSFVSNCTSGEPSNAGMIVIEYGSAGLFFFYSHVLLSYFM